MNLLNISYKIIFYEEKGCTISTRNKRKKEIKIKNKTFCEDRLHSKPVYLHA